MASGTHHHKGFTLLELLVTIAILGVLSAIVFASLNASREKSRTAAIKAQAAEFGKIMAQEYSDTGSYAALNRGWSGTASDCSARGFSGTYGPKALAMCNKLRELIENKSTNDVYTGVNTGAGFSNSLHFSIIVRLPSGLYYCLGSSGRNSDQGTGANGWIAPGCYGNP